MISMIHRPSFSAEDSGFRIQDSGFRIQDSGFSVDDSGFEDSDFSRHLESIGKFRSTVVGAQGFGFRVSGLGFRV